MSGPTGKEWVPGDEPETWGLADVEPEEEYEFDHTAEEILPDAWDDLFEDRL